ncbi:tripartite tricarboxylate transporter substrate-binding protein, partial [Burkholderia sola]|uniref:tripartite tricarboxylate transporter substrate-binding protein n=1 Tax=Burkholderia sola TaxID=2843302 RepID=UPI00338FC94B
LAPVSVLARNPIALVALPSFPAGSVRELVDYARSRGDLSYASTGNGNGTNLAMEMFLAGSAIQMVHVPYKGGAPAITDLIGGQVDFSFQNVNAVLPHLRSG